MLQSEIEEIRRLAKNLHPPLLDLGINTAITSFIEEFGLTHEDIIIRDDIHIPENSIPEFLKIAIFRVLQEALNNVAKHSRAGAIKITLLNKEDLIQMTIQDDGQGFTQGGRDGYALPDDGFGIPSMKERVQLSGGDFHLESHLGKGTTITATWPVSVVTP